MLSLKSLSPTRECAQKGAAGGTATLFNASASMSRVECSQSDPPLLALQIVQLDEAMPTIVSSSRENSTAQGGSAGESDVERIRSFEAGLLPIQHKQDIVSVRLECMRETSLQNLRSVFPQFAREKETRKSLFSSPAAQGYTLRDPCGQRLKILTD